MSDGFLVTDGGNYSFREKSVAKKSKALGLLVILLAVVLVSLAVVYLIISPCAMPVQIQFRGLQTLSAAELLEAAGVEPGKTWITFDTAPVAAALSMNPLIESVSVEKHFPTQVVITVTERVVAAVSLVNIDGRTVPVQIDRNGVLFRINEGMPAGNVPIISGLTFEQPRAGSRLHAKLRPLMERLARIQETNPAYFAAISEIRIVAKEYGTYELVLYPMRSQVKVLVDRTLNDESLKHMIVVLDVLKSLNTQVKAVDLRYGAISYITADGGVI